MANYGPRPTITPATATTPAVVPSASYLVDEEEASLQDFAPLGFGGGVPYQTADDYFFEGTGDTQMLSPIDTGGFLAGTEDVHFSEDEDDDDYEDDGDDEDEEYDFDDTISEHDDDDDVSEASRLLGEMTPEAQHHLRVEISGGIAMLDVEFKQVVATRQKVRQAVAEDPERWAQFVELYQEPIEAVLLCALDRKGLPLFLRTESVLRIQSKRVALGDWLFDKVVDGPGHFYLGILFTVVKADPTFAKFMEYICHYPFPSPQTRWVIPALHQYTLANTDRLGGLYCLLNEADIGDLVELQQVLNSDQVNYDTLANVLATLPIVASYLGMARLLGRRRRCLGDLSRNPVNKRVKEHLCDGDTRPEAYIAVGYGDFDNVLPRLAVHAVESLLIVAGDYTGDELGCNVNLVDARVFAILLPAKEYRLLLESVNHVLEHSDPAANNNLPLTRDNAAWTTVFASVFNGHLPISPEYLAELIKGRYRRYEYAKLVRQGKIETLLARGRELFDVTKYCPASPQAANLYSTYNQLVRFHPQSPANLLASLEERIEKAVQHLTAGA